MTEPFGHGYVITRSEKNVSAVPSSWPSLWRIVKNALGGSRFTQWTNRNHRLKSGRHPPDNRDVSDLACLIWLIRWASNEGPTKSKYSITSV
jgi:hypothetical protein